MSAILEKARAGRANALAARASTPSMYGNDAVSRFAFTAPRRHETPTFISARARSSGQEFAL